MTYLWSLSLSGYANSFYAAAAQAGSQSWKAWFFGSLDAANAITVDKPPAALWVMGLSARVFGVSPWSILVPEALMGVGVVALVFLLVRRVAPWPSAIAAGALTALMPSAALMFRYDNPDALLLLLLVGAGYATVRAIETGRSRWLMLAGVLLGFGFLTKMLQAFLVLPAFGLAYLIAGPRGVRRRLVHLVSSFGAMVVSAGWWIAIVELMPASARPYIDGSTTNSILELALGYNGLGRINGDETGGLGNAGFSSGVGILRLFQGVSGGMVAWILPAALILLVAAFVALRKSPRTDLARAALIVTGGSMLVTGLVFSFMAGIYHDYYTVALAPWIATTALIGAAVVWRSRESLVARLTLVVAMLASTIWAVVLLGQSGEQPYSALRWPVLIIGLAVSVGLVFSDRLIRRDVAILLVSALVALGIGPAAYSIQTIGTSHTGGVVTAGPYAGNGLGGPGGRPGGGEGGPGGGPGAGPGAGAGGPQGGQALGGGAGGQLGAQPGGAPGGGEAGPGGFGRTETVASELATTLGTNAGNYRWIAATTGAENAASYELATGESVMAIGGFNGTAPSMSLAQFKKYVAAGDIHYFIAGGGTGGGGGRGAEGQGAATQTTSDASEITSWVEKTFTSTTVDGTTVYDLGTR